MVFVRLAAVLLAALLLGACAQRDLDEAPVPLGEFRLGHNIVVTDKMQKVPISRDATGAEWEAAMKKAVADRFGRYQGEKFYNLGISVDAFALAPPGIPLVISPKSALVITATIFDDAAGKKLNEEGARFTIFESLDAGTVVGSGLTKTREEQMETLAFNAAKRVERWLTENPQWFGLPPLPPKPVAEEN